ncbi:hypothetical protein D3C72_2044670 [compost metagenome]
MGEQRVHRLAGRQADAFVAQMQLQRQQRQLRLQLRTEQCPPRLHLVGVVEQLPLQGLWILSADVQFTHQGAHIGFIHPVGQVGTAE